MKILITGGLGKIGSCLCESMSQTYDIVVLDNFSNNSSIVPYVDIIKGDVRDRKMVDSIINEVDIVIHMAAQISVDKSIDNPIYDADNNINGTLNILEASRKSDIKRFIYISSAAVYGKPIYLPIDEKHPTNPMSPYGLSKLTGERYSMLYHDLYKLPVTCLRLFNIFGFKNSEDSYSGVITKFIDRVKNNKNPIIFGDGNQIRDFIYVNDVINIISETIENKDTIGEILNVGTGNPTKIINLSEAIIEIFDKKLMPEFISHKIGDIRESYADITKMKSILKYEPKYSLEQGLIHLIKGDSFLNDSLYSL